ncbi:MAG: phosphoribosylglycinamide formyltransferase [Chloroflexi bacterium]|nr:phosphoribosylglycinamide formyltransferase [Chloroflexota bacterium]
MTATAGGARLAVLVSGRGRGTNFQAILDGCRSGRAPASVELLASTTPDTPAMARAVAAGVPALYLDPSAARSITPGDPGVPVDPLDEALFRLLQHYEIDLVCLAGFMRKVGPHVLAAYANRIMNVHPSLVPAFAGPGMYGPRVHSAVLEYGARVSGCTVQFINEEYDAGPIILQKPVPVLEDDTVETLSARVLEQEHIAYVEAIRLFAEGRLRVEGRRVRVLDQSAG